jgi:predicted RNA binding protein YcfA (HicA-like mRNA interferase family)
MKIREVIRMLRDDGWEEVVQKGSHRQFKHPIKKGRVTVAGRLGDELPKGTLGSILRQAQLKEKP